jgi:hypothetical protein
MAREAEKSKITELYLVRAFSLHHNKEKHESMHETEIKWEVKLGTDKGKKKQKKKPDMNC